MYEGENRAAQLSQRHIADAMLRLLREQPFSELSVSTLCRQASVSRQTFYSLFGTREQVLVYALRTGCRYDPEPERQVCRSACFRDFCRGYSRYIVRNREILELLVRNDMMHCLYDMQYESFLHCEHFLQGMDAAERQYLAAFIAGGMSSIARTYVRTGCRAGAEELETLMYRLFGGDYLASPGGPGA